MPCGGTRGSGRPESPEADHWHRTESDEGRPYAFVDAETLIVDFFREVRRVLAERGLADAVVRVDKGRGDR